MNSEGVSAAAREVSVRIAWRRPPRVLLPQGFCLTLFYKKKKIKIKFTATQYLSPIRGVVEHGRLRSYIIL